MRLTERHRYDAQPAAVWAVLIDPAFREEVCRATGATSWDVAVDADDGGGRVTIVRVVPTAGSGPVQKLVGETVRITQTEQWGPADGDGARRADTTLDLDAQPASMRGTSTLAPERSGCVLDVAGELEVRIPLLGRKLEKELGSAVEAALRTEHDILLRHLT